MPPAVETHTDQQSAVRLLAAICAAAVPPVDDSLGSDVVGVLRSQSRLQALDFWIRYPDYLAAELLKEFEKTASKADLALARRIFDDREPDLRRVPMIRYHFGAFEPLHNPLSILRSRGLVRQHPDRSDAQVYAAAIDVVRSFARGAVEADLASASKALEAAAADRSFLLSAGHLPDWLTPRRDRDLQWYELLGRPLAGSPVSVGDRCLVVRLPAGMTPREFDKQLAFRMKSARLNSWLRTPDGERHCQYLGIDPAQLARGTAYGFNEALRRSDGEEIYFFRPKSFDADRLLRLAETIVYRYVTTPPALRRSISWRSRAQGTRSDFKPTVS